MKFSLSAMHRSELEHETTQGIRHCMSRLVSKLLVFYIRPFVESVILTVLFHLRVVAQSYCAACIEASASHAGEENKHREEEHLHPA